MATVDVISISGQDAKGATGRMTYYVPSGESVANITLQAQAMASLLDAVSAMKLNQIALTLSIALPGGLKGAATAGHDVERGANVGLDCANTVYRTTVRVPAVLESIAPGDTMNIASGAGLVFVNGLITGVPPVLPSDKFANDITAALEALVTFRKS